jgi:hypothetical protein
MLVNAFSDKVKGLIEPAEIPMRALPLFAAGLAILSLPAMAEAQTRSSLYIEAKPRSWLDPGREVRPHSMQNYVYDTQGSGIPSAGAGFSNQGLLPGRFSGGSMIKIDIPAPDFLRK